MDHVWGQVSEKLQTWREFKAAMSLTENLTDLFPDGMKDLATFPFAVVKELDPAMEIAANYAIKVEEAAKETQSNLETISNRNQKVSTIISEL